MGIRPSPPEPTCEKRPARPESACQLRPSRPESACQLRPSRPESVAHFRPARAESISEKQPSRPEWVTYDRPASVCDSRADDIQSVISAYSKSSKTSSRPQTAPGKPRVTPRSGYGVNNSINEV